MPKTDPFYLFLTALTLLALPLPFILYGPLPYRHTLYEPFPDPTLPLCALFPQGGMPL